MSLTRAHPMLRPKPSSPWVSADKLAQYVNKQLKGQHTPVEYASTVLGCAVSALTELSYDEGKTVLDAAKAVSA